jgi:hypothetical protein
MSAIRERILVAAIGRVVNFVNTVCTSGDFRQNHGSCSPPHFAIADQETRFLLVGSRMLLPIVYACRRCRALDNRCDKRVNGCALALRFHENSLRVIANPTAQAQGLRCSIYERSEANALHTTAQSKLHSHDC